MNSTNWIFQFHVIQHVYNYRTAFRSKCMRFVPNFSRIHIKRKWSHRDTDTHTHARTHARTHTHTHTHPHPHTHKACLSVGQSSFTQKTKQNKTEGRRCNMIIIYRIALYLTVITSHLFSVWHLQRIVQCAMKVVRTHDPNSQWPTWTKVVRSTGVRSV